MHSVIAGMEKSSSAISPFPLRAVRILYTEDEYICSQKHIHTDLFILPDAVSGRFYELRVHRVVDLPLPDRMPDFPVLDDFKWRTCLQRSHPTQIACTFCLAPRLLDSTQLKKSRMPSSARKKKQTTQATSYH